MMKLTALLISLAAATGCLSEPDRAPAEADQASELEATTAIGSCKTRCAQLYTKCRRDGEDPELCRDLQRGCLVGCTPVE